VLSLLTAIPRADAVTSHNFPRQPRGEQNTRAADRFSRDPLVRRARFADAWITRKDRRSALERAPCHWSDATGQFIGEQTALTPDDRTDLLDGYDDVHLDGPVSGDHDCSLDEHARGRRLQGVVPGDQREEGEPSLDHVAGGGK
jgi:hypothetical protein